jgi:hypothetical protein
MSLTSCLDDRRSPLRLFLEAELPDAAALVSHYRSRLPQHPDAVQPHSSGPIDHQSLGQAIDLQLRIAFGSPVTSTVVTGIGRAATQLADTRSCAAALALAEPAQRTPRPTGRAAARTCGSAAGRGGRGGTPGPAVLRCMPVGRRR